MKNELKVIIYSVLVLGLFFTSFVLFINDLINYSLVCFALTIVCVVGLFIHVFTRNDPHSVFIRDLKKVLKTYDSDIVYSDEEYIVSEKDIFFVKTIEDLLKASNELDAPIIYYSEETAAVFMVKNDDILLVFLMKENPNEISDYEHYLLKHIENTTGSKKVVLNNITEETIIKLGEKFYKVTPMKNQFGMVYY